MSAADAAARARLKAIIDAAFERRAELSPHNLTPAGRRMAAGLAPW